MKKIIIISIIFTAILSINSALAQNYYTQDTIRTSQNTFKCDLMFNGQDITIYGLNDRYIYAKKKYADGSSMDKDLAEGKVETVEDDDWSVDLASAIVQQAFSPAERQIVSGAKFMIGIVVDPKTGKVTEVFFRFLADPLGKIHPDTYGKIAKQLKEQIYFNTTPIGKTLEFIRFTWVEQIE